MQKVSIIIPVYNEKLTVESVIELVKQSPVLGMEKEIIVIDDFSHDGSREFLQSLHDPNLKIILHEKNQGKGAAIKTGLKNATGDIVLIQDADLEYDTSDYPALLTPFTEPATQVVYGYRTQPGYKVYYLGNKFFTGFVNLLFGSDLKDPYTCYKVIKRDLFMSLNLVNKGFEIEAEITAKILKRKIDIVQVPISYKHRTFEKGKKIRLLEDGTKGLWTFFKYRFLVK